MASVTEQLEKLADLFERGIITREQLEKQRDVLLSGTDSDGRPSRIGSYEITGDIGEGGMAVVYRGRHRAPAFAQRQGGDVAIKVLRAEYASRPEIVERFEREAKLGIQLDHPGIVEVHDLVMEGRRVALIMEFVAGRALSKMIGTETGPIIWEKAEPMVLELLDALEYAHSQGVVHRDLKPDNIMVGPEGRLKILDFGIAKELGAAGGKTSTSMGMGTIDYMATEQYLNAKFVDARADIYALGMTIYEMLAGRLPWADSASEYSILEAKKNGQIPPPSTFYPHISPHIESVVMRMIRPDQEDRYPAIVDVRAALRHPPSGRAVRTLPEIHPLRATDSVEGSDPSLISSVSDSGAPPTRTAGASMDNSIKVLAALSVFFLVFLVFKIAGGDDASVSMRDDEGRNEPTGESPTSLASTEADDESDDAEFGVEMTTISLGKDWTCVVDTVGRLQCWKGAPNRPLEDYTTIRDPGDGGFVGVSLDASELISPLACGLTDGGTIYCGAADEDEWESPLPGSYGDVSVHGNRIWAVTLDRNIVSWEWDGQDFDRTAVGLPVGTYTNVRVGGWGECAWDEPNDTRCEPDEILTILYGPIRDISVGIRDMCILTMAGIVECIDDNSLDPPSDSSLSGFRSVSVGDIHACGVTASQRVECWGDDYGTVPSQRMMAVSAGYHHSCGVTENRRVVCWDEDGLVDMHREHDWDWIARVSSD